MRIISQEGTSDLPYENIAITIGRRGDNEEFYIFAHLVNSADPKKDQQKLASYSTEAKAQKAMEMLREKYERYEIACSEYTVNWFDYPKVFQFPKDEDVEV